MQTKRIIASFGPRIFLPALIAAALFLLLGCGEAAFYSQAASGQVALLNRREPIAHLIQDPATPDTLKKRLALVLEIRRFAFREGRVPPRPVRETAKVREHAVPMLREAKKKGRISDFVQLSGP